MLVGKEYFLCNEYSKRRRCRAFDSRLQLQSSQTSLVCDDFFIIVADLVVLLLLTPKITDFGDPVLVVVSSAFC